MKRSMLLLAMGCALALAGCAFPDQDTDNQASHEILTDPAEAEMFSAASENGTEGCQSSYDPDVTTVRNFIHNQCGGITACGSADSFNHADVFIGGSYCSCYDKLFANRGGGAFSRVQVIYHEPQACSAKHIHIEKKNLCGRIHFDVDESNDNNCFADEPSSKWDRYTGGGNCSLLHNSRVGTCGE